MTYDDKRKQRITRYTKRAVADIHKAMDALDKARERVDLERALMIVQVKQNLYFALGDIVIIENKILNH